MEKSKQEFKVRIVETLEREVVVPAENCTEALNSVMSGYKQTKYVLDADDLSDVSFSIITTDNENSHEPNCRIPLPRDNWHVYNKLYTISLAQFLQKQEGTSYRLDNVTFCLHEHEKDMIEMSIDGVSETFISSNQYDLMQLYEEHTGKEFRVCSVCGCPFNKGFMQVDGDYYACSEECLELDSDRRYGFGNWAWPENKNLDSLMLSSFDENVGSIIYYDSSTCEWNFGDIFYTEW